jgi:hypothetical protein
LDKAGDVEPNYTDGITCIREAENKTCEVQRDGVVTYIGMLERKIKRWRYWEIMLYL